MKTYPVSLAGDLPMIDSRHVSARDDRKKDGKEHRYWSVVENKRVAGGRVVQRHVLYLGEINSSQELAWRKTIEVLDEDSGAPAERWRCSRRIAAKGCCRTPRSSG